MGPTDTDVPADPGFGRPQRRGLVISPAGSTFNGGRRLTGSVLEDPPAGLEELRAVLLGEARPAPHIAA